MIRSQKKKSRKPRVPSDRLSLQYMSSGCRYIINIVYNIHTSSNEINTPSFLVRLEFIKYILIITMSYVICCYLLIALSLLHLW